MNGHSVPILGPHQVIKSPLPGFVGLARSVDEQGLVTCDQTVQGPDGQLMGVAGRDSFLDGTELLEMIRLIVHEEISQAFTAERLRHGSKAEG